MTHKEVNWHYINSDTIWTNVWIVTWEKGTWVQEGDSTIGNGEQDAVIGKYDIDGEPHFLCSKCVWPLSLKQLVPLNESLVLQGNRQEISCNHQANWATKIFKKDSISMMFSS